MKKTQKKSFKNFDDSSKLDLNAQKNVKGGFFNRLMKTTMMILGPLGLFRDTGGNGNGVW